MKQIILGCFLALLVACGDSTSEVYKENMSVVAEVSDLPDCTEENEGELVFVTADSAMRVCAKEKWYFAENSSPTFDYSCTTKELKNKKGIKVVCNGDSVGVVLNGSQGKTGRAGEGCTIDNWTDSTVTITCGDSTVTLEIGGSRTPDVKDTVVRDSDEVPLDSEAVAVSLDSLAGYTQKGPFTKGSTVYLYELTDGRTLKQTNGNFTSNIVSDDGRYKFTARDLTSQYALLIVDGYYRNEVTGAVSGAPIRLKAISNMLMRRSANVNLLTHLEFERVYYLVTKEKMTVRAAKRKAQKEILTAFHIDTTGMKTESEDLDVFGSSDADAALLAISILLQGDRSETDLMALLAEISNDLAEDGLWNDDRSARIKAEIADWAFFQDLAKFRKNVEGWGLNTKEGIGGFEKYINNFIAKSYDIDTCVAVNYDTVQKINNSFSAYNGRTYQCYPDSGYKRPNRITWVEIKDNPYLNDTIEYKTMIDWRNRRLYHIIDVMNGRKYLGSWMAEDLDIEYRVKGAPYGNSYQLTHGYTWAAAMDSAAVYSSAGASCGDGKTCSASGDVQGLCPDGWILPTKSDWVELIETVDGVDYTEDNFDKNTAAKALKATSGWNGDEGSTNEYGFSAIPEGSLDFYWDSDFRSDWGDKLGYWSSTENGNSLVYIAGIYSEGYQVELTSSRNFKSDAHPIRCLQRPVMVFPN